MNYGSKRKNTTYKCKECNYPPTANIVNLRKHVRIKRTIGLTNAAYNVLDLVDGHGTCYIKGKLFSPLSRVMRITSFPTNNNPVLYSLKAML